jgi:tetratricopeptide (TPR) repeat protein
MSKYQNEVAKIGAMLSQMGDEYSAKGHSDNAIECYTKVVELQLADNQLFTKLGNAHLAKHNEAMAIECYSKAREMDPEDPWAFHWLQTTNYYGTRKLE